MHELRENVPRFILCLWHWQEGSTDMFFIFSRVSVAQKIWSSSNKMLISFRPQPAAQRDDFVEGAYMFHNGEPATDIKPS